MHSSGASIKTSSLQGSVFKNSQSYIASPLPPAPAVLTTTTGSAHFPADLHIDEPPTEPTLLESIRAVWLTMKVIYPYQAAAFIPPLVTAAILPMIFGMDFSVVSNLLNKHRPH